jgi:hypothetical protein
MARSTSGGSLIPRTVGLIVAALAVVTVVLVVLLIVAGA